MRRTLSSNYCPVSAEINDYLDREEREPEMERARCLDCGRFYAREINLLVPPKRCPTHERDHHALEYYAALVARSPLLQSIEGARRAHIILGSLDPERRTA